MKDPKETLTAVHSVWWFAEKLNDLQEIQMITGREKQKINNLINSIDILEKKVSKPFNFDGNLGDRVMITNDVFDSICTFMDNSTVDQMQELFKILGLDSKYGVKDRG